ncbi:solute carrier family 23 protein [Brevibacterium sp. UCMA 11754]|uniref:solute carrier family 23 protein n=1 Tax=Brevibacterium sp. UCMA 11754 TaxID=2749198 RepID=UPI001F35A86B|nr:solute carrier family 23 protein [Brevibacterium sp. UCMA 11754]MCF2573512.1 hypothetical protein [Brevibacterium sp. UCMA 11754]
MTAAPEAAETVHPVDQLRPMHRLIPFAIQHVLVMVATPISSVFLIAGALDLDEAATSAILAAVFIFSGLGSILQSVGVWKIGVKLPFVMLPGGAATVLFITIGQGTDIETAVGAVIGVAMAAFVSVLLNLLFHHTGKRNRHPKSRTAIDDPSHLAQRPGDYRI